MKVSPHGGYCCGVTHISGLIVGDFLKLEAGDYPQRPEGFTYGGSYVWGLKVPEETYKERFRRFVAWRKTVQGQGLIEVTTHDCKYPLGGANYTTQTDWWREELEKTGFKAVTEFYNSNSGRRVTVWHYAYGGANETKEGAA